MEGQGNFLSRLIVGITGIDIGMEGVILILRSPPDPPNNISQELDGGMERRIREWDLGLRVQLHFMV